MDIPKAFEPGKRRWIRRLVIWTVGILLCFGWFHQYRRANNAEADAEFYEKKLNESLDSFDMLYETHTDFLDYVDSTIIPNHETDSGYVRIIVDPTFKIRIEGNTIINTTEDSL